MRTEKLYHPTVEKLARAITEGVADPDTPVIVHGCSHLEVRYLPDGIHLVGFDEGAHDDRAPAD